MVSTGFGEKSFHESQVEHAQSQIFKVLSPEVFLDSGKNQLLLYFSNPPIPIGGIIEQFGLSVNDTEVDMSAVRVYCSPKTTSQNPKDMKFTQGSSILITIRHARGLLQEKSKKGRLEFKIYARIKGIGAFPFSYFSFSKRKASIPRRRTEQILKLLKKQTPLTRTFQGVNGPGKPYVLSNTQGYLILDSESNDIYAKTLWGGLPHVTSGHFNAPKWGIRTIRTATTTTTTGKFSPIKGKLAWTAHNTESVLIEYGVVSSTHKQPGGVLIEKQTFLPRPVKDIPEPGEALMLLHKVSNTQSVGGKNAKKKKKVSYILEITPALLPYGNISALLKNDVNTTIESGGRALRFSSKKTKITARFASTIPFKAYTSKGRLIAPGQSKILNEPRVFLVYDLAILPDQSISFQTAASVGAGRALSQLIKHHARVLNTVRTHYRNVFLNVPAIVTPDPQLDETYKRAITALDTLKFEKPDGPVGIVAGLPRFPNIWVRDAGETLGALLLTNDFEFFKKSIEFILSKMSSKGEVPTVISGADYFHEKIKYGSFDATPYIPILLKEYVEASGDTEWLQKNYQKLKAMMSFLLKRRAGNNLPTHGPYATWMDHSRRGNTAIEVVALECEAFRSAATIARILDASGTDADSWDAEAERLKDAINTKFWDDKSKTFRDALGDAEGVKDVRRPNILVPIIFGIAEEKKADLELDRIQDGSDGLLAPHGVRSLSNKSPSYSSHGYHDGCVWGLTTGWLAMAQFARGRSVEGFETLSKMSERIKDENGMYAEVYLGKFPAKSHSSTVLQAFSIGPFIRTIILHVFGIKIFAHEKRVLLNPHFPPEWQRAQINNVAVGRNNFIDLSFDNKAGTITVYNRGREEIEFVSSDGNAMPVIGGNITVLPIARGYYDMGTTHKQESTATAAATAAAAEKE